MVIANNKAIKVDFLKDTPDANPTEIIRRNIDIDLSGGVAKTVHGKSCERKFEKTFHDSNKYSRAITNILLKGKFKNSKKEVIKMIGNKTVKTGIATILAKIPTTGAS